MRREELRLVQVGVAVIAANIAAAVVLASCGPTPAPALTGSSTPAVELGGTVRASAVAAAPRVAKPSRARVDMTVGLRKAQRKKVPFTVWRSSPTARRVAWRESNNRCDITNPSGKYMGRWQMDSNFWRTYGGRKYAPAPHKATCAQQDRVAYRGWIARGWKPWVTA